MSNYKQYVKELNDELDSFKYFYEERLRLLMISVDLQIANRELKDLVGFDERVDEAASKVQAAKDSFDTMFVKYETAIIKYDKIRNETMALIGYLKDLEKQVNAQQEL